MGETTVSHAGVFLGGSVRDHSKSIRACDSLSLPSGVSELSSLQSQSFVLRLQLECHHGQRGWTWHWFPWRQVSNSSSSLCNGIILAFS